MSHERSLLLLVHQPTMAMAENNKAMACGTYTASDACCYVCGNCVGILIGGLDAASAQPGLI